VTQQDLERTLRELTAGHAELRAALGLLQPKAAPNPGGAAESGQNLCQHVLDTLPQHIALIDETGEIIMVNAAWRRFAARHGDPSGKTCVGANYLHICERCDGDSWAEEAYGAIRAVLLGDMNEYLLDYPCHSPVERRWFAMWIAPLHGPCRGAVIAHVDITERKLAQLALAGATGKIGCLAEKVEQLEEENARLREKLGLPPRED
jgi:PAS domain-containing protein